MPTGWRPADAAAKYPVYKIEDPYHFQKYDTQSTKGFTAWVWIQFVLLIAFISYLFGNIATIGSPGIFYYGAFVFLFVYAYTELMDRNPYAWVWELAKSALGLALLYQTGDWFGAGKLFTGTPYLLIIYFIATAMISMLFSVNKSIKTAGA